MPTWKQSVAKMRGSPLGSLLVEHAAATLDATDRVSSLQGELGTAVAADVKHGKTLGFNGTAGGGRVTSAWSAGAAGGNLVTSARHCSEVGEAGGRLRSWRVICYKGL